MKLLAFIEALHEDAEKDMNYQSAARHLFDYISKYIRWKDHDAFSVMNTSTGTAIWFNVGKAIGELGDRGPATHYDNLYFVVDHPSREHGGPCDLAQIDVGYALRIHCLHEFYTAPAILRYLMEYRDEIIHELIHYLDYRRTKNPFYRAGTAKYVRAGRFDKYFNHPFERNAYFQQALSRIVRLLKDENLTQEEKEYLIPKDFNAFLKVFYHLLHGGVEDHLSERNKRRLARRLHNVWQHLLPQVYPQTNR